QLRAVTPGRLPGEESREQLSRGVERDDPTLEVDRHHAGRQRAEDTVGVALQIGQLEKPAGELPVDVLERRPLLQELLRHVVERQREPTDLVGGRRPPPFLELAPRGGGGAPRPPSPRARAVRRPPGP